MFSFFFPLVLLLLFTTDAHIRNGQVPAHAQGVGGTVLALRRVLQQLIFVPHSKNTIIAVSGIYT